MEHLRRLTIWCCLLLAAVGSARSQYFDTGSSKDGQLTGDIPPLAVAGITILVVAVFAALAVTIFLCYFVRRKQQKAMRVPNGYVSVDFRA